VLGAADSLATSPVFVGTSCGAGRSGGRSRRNVTESAVDPWQQDVGAVAGGLGTDPSTGLTSTEASARLGRVGPNRLDPEPPVPAWRKLLAQFVDPLVFLLLAAVAISLVTWAIDGADGVPFEAVVIGAILVANAVLGYVQEARAEQAVAALQRMAAATSAVVRDGLEVRIAAAEVVPGDVLLLAEGDAVSADGRLVEAASLTVAEAALTGESEPVLKDSGTLPGLVSVGDRVNMVFSGTAVTRGRGRAIVTGTGMATEIGRIAGLLGSTVEEPTPLQKEIARVGRTLGIAVLLIATVVVAAIFLTSDVEGAADVVDVLLVGVSHTHPQRDDGRAGRDPLRGGRRHRDRLRAGRGTVGRWPPAGARPPARRGPRRPLRREPGQ
jgi:Ca2+-transporting ATPase